MVETITAVLTEVVDRLIALVREGKSSRRELFENHIEPIFHMIEEVMADYLSLFSELEGEFQNPAITPSTTIEKILARRYTTATLRVKTSQYADALHDAFSDDEIKRFALSCRNLLRHQPSYAAPVGHGFASRLTGMLSEIGMAVADYHKLAYELDIDIDHGSITSHTRAGGIRIDCRAVVDSTPRDLFFFMVRANRKAVERAWSNAAENYYRLKVRLIR